MRKLSFALAALVALAAAAPSTAGSQDQGFGCAFGDRFGRELGRRFGSPTTCTAAAAFAGVIDNVIAAGGSSANFCGSVSHRLYSAYTGDLITIQRVSDDATTGIGYNVSDNRLNEAAIVSFCGASDCNVRTLEDQCGSNRDVTQTTEAQQPKIYDGATTSVVKQGSLPWATQTGLAASSPGWARGDSIGISGASGLTVFYHAAYTTTATNNRIMICIGAASGRIAFGAAQNTPAAGDVFTWIINGTGIRYFTDSPASTSPNYFVHSLGAGAQVSTTTIRENGAALTQSSLSNGTVTLNMSGSIFTIGSDQTSTIGYTGGGSTWMVWGSELTGGTLTAVENFGAVLGGLD